MKHLDLFSGIGGFALAAMRAGIETVGFCEIEEYPRKVLEKNFPGVPIHHDIRELDGSEYEGIDIITGGYPCQPFSTAGKRKGQEDDRHLWPEMLRVITQARPAWVIAENVAGHITMGLDRVLTDLESEGYTTRAITIPACAVDAKHRRDRVWIIANANGDILREQSRGCSGTDWESQTLASIDGKAQLVANTESVGHKRLEGASKQARRSGLEPGFGWEAEPGVGRVVDGFPGRVDRIRALGNAIVPQVAYEIMSVINN